METLLRITVKQRSPKSFYLVSPVARQAGRDDQALQMSADLPRLLFSISLCEVEVFSSEQIVLKYRYLINPYEREQTFQFV